VKAGQKKIHEEKSTIFVTMGMVHFALCAKSLRGHRFVAGIGRLERREAPPIRHFANIYKEKQLPKKTTKHPSLIAPSNSVETGVGLRRVLIKYHTGAIAKRFSREAR